MSRKEDVSAKFNLHPSVWKAAFFAGQKAVFGVVKRLIAQGYIRIFIFYIHCFVIRSAIGNSQALLRNCRIVAAKIQIFNRRAAFLIPLRATSGSKGLRPTHLRAEFFFKHPIHIIYV